MLRVSLSDLPGADTQSQFLPTHAVPEPMLVSPYDTLAPCVGATCGSVFWTPLMNEHDFD